MRRVLLSLSLIAASLPLAAEVRIPNVFSDHAVIQRDKPVRVWGWARPGEHVTVAFHKQTRPATANDYGQWETWLVPEVAGGPYTLTVMAARMGSTCLRMPASSTTAIFGSAARR